MRVKCPTCHTEVAWEENTYRPFCSERCKLIDLGQWATEQYRIAGSNRATEKEGEERKTGERESQNESCNGNKQ